jgi:hypothetical protein
MEKMSNQKLAKVSREKFQENLALELEKLAEINYLEDPRAQQQEGAEAVLDLVELFKIHGEQICSNDFLDDSNSEFELELACLLAKVLMRLRDLQVRDFALGSITDENLETFLSMWRWIVRIAPTVFLAPVATLLAATYYEASEPDLARISLAKALDADHQYPLALLLQRVFAADWPPETFATMRSELHPKVTAAIFN